MGRTRWRTAVVLAGGLLGGVAQGAVAERGFQIGPNCFTATIPASVSEGGAAPLELRFALLVTPAEAGCGDGLAHSGTLAARFGGQAEVARDYLNWPICRSAPRAPVTAIARCGGSNDSEHIALSWEGEALVLTTTGVTLEAGEMPEIRTRRLAPDAAATASEAVVRYRLTRAPVAVCAGIGPWEWDG